VRSSVCSGELRSLSTPKVRCAPLGRRTSCQALIRLRRRELQAKRQVQRGVCRPYVLSRKQWTYHHADGEKLWKKYRQKGNGTKRQKRRDDRVKEELPNSSSAHLLTARVRPSSLLSPVKRSRPASTVYVR